MSLRRRALISHSKDVVPLAVAGAILGPAAVACGPAQGQPAGSTPAAQSSSATAAPAADKPQRGGTYTVASFSDAGTLQPLLSNDTASSAYIDKHYSAPLIRRNPETLDFDTKYGTAESYQVAPDNLSITFKLKTNVTWSDGKPITAQDYKFTYDKMLDPKVDYPYRGNYADFEGLEAPDDRTLIFKLKTPLCTSLSQTTFEPIPRHVFQDQNINDNPFNQKPTVGSGPWILQEWVKDDHAIFAANEKFYLGRPNLDRIVYRVVKDQNVEFAMLKAGEVDAASLRAEVWDEAKKLTTVNTVNYYPASASWTYLGLNNKHDLLKDVKVRQALAYAIDRNKMVERIRFNHAKPLNSIYASASWAYTDDVQKYNFDVNRAKQLLDEAGWKAPSADATRVKDGKPLRVRVFYNAGNNEREQIATIAQQSFKAIGVDAEVVAEEWNAYLNRVQKTHDIEVYVLGWSASLEPNGFRNIFMTDKAQNDSQYSNPKVDDLFPQAAVVPGCKQDDRKKIYVEIQKIISSEAPYIFLWENESLSAVNNRIVTNPLTKLGYSYRQWEWYSKTGK